MAKNISSHKKLIIISGIVLLVVLASLFVVQKKNDSHGTPANTNQGGTTNLSPATAEDLQRAEDNKQRILDQDSKQSNPASAPSKTVTPTITYAGQYGASVEVGAYVNGIFEDGGSCTATFKQGTQTLSKTVSAVKSAQSVDCPVMSLNATEFKQKGTWGVTVSYSSANYSGISDQRQLEVK